MRHEILITALAAVFLTTSAATALAESSHGKGHSKGHASMHHGKKMHGWMADLDEAQQKQIDKLHLKHKGEMHLVKAKMKQVKIELARLEASDNPDTTAIDKKIDALVELKREKLKQRAMHHIEIRKLLNEDQRLKFDMHLLKKAAKGKHGRHGKSH